MYCTWFCICTVSHTWQYISKESWFMQYKKYYYSLFSFVVLHCILYLHSFPHMTVHKQRVLIYAVQKSTVTAFSHFSYCIWLCTVSHTRQYMSKETWFMQYKKSTVTAFSHLLYCIWLCVCTVSHTWQYISKESSLYAVQRKVLLQPFLICCTAFEFVFARFPTHDST